jgi:two-component system response regulator VicR
MRGESGMPPQEPKLVVYIEDEPELIDLLRLILKNEKIEVKGTARGQAGLDLVRQSLPDLVVLDLMLPDMTGWDVFWEMQHDPVLRNIPVIVVTVRTEGIREVVWPQMEQLAGYVIKPFTVAELREAVKRALGLSPP